MLKYPSVALIWLLTHFVCVQGAAQASIIPELPEPSEGLYEDEGNYTLKEVLDMSLLAATAVLESERGCVEADPSCVGVGFDYHYPWRSGYDVFLETVSYAVWRYSSHLPENEVHEVISSVVAISWAESAWGTYRTESLNSPRSTGEVSPWQIISCEFGPWQEWVQCEDAPYVNAVTRPTAAWLSDWQNAADWAVTHWMNNPSAARYNGCRTSQCNYATRFSRRSDAAMGELSGT